MTRKYLGFGTTWLC